MIIIALTIVFLIGVFFEKSDYHLKKEANNLPPFTKEDAIKYYDQTFNQNK